MSVPAMTEELRFYYVVLHEHLLESDQPPDQKFIGVYNSSAEAEAAVGRLAEAPGFRDTPHGFRILEFPLDRDHWVEGFADPALIVTQR